MAKRLPHISTYVDNGELSPLQQRYEDLKLVREGLPLRYGRLVQESAAPATAGPGVTLSLSQIRSLIESFAEVTRPATHRVRSVTESAPVTAPQAPDEVTVPSLNTGAGKREMRELLTAVYEHERPPRSSPFWTAYDAGATALGIERPV